MDLNYEPVIQELYKKWSAVGWRVTEDTYRGEIDIEKLIIETTHAARIDGRLLKWLLTWFRDFGDLVNKKKLIRQIKNADSAVLGAVLEIAMNNGADQNYRTVQQKCEPKKPKEVLQKDMEAVDIYLQEQKEYGRKEYRTWGLYCTMIEFYDDAVRTREWVLAHNELLAIRAVFGVSLRAELIYLLKKSGRLTIRRISTILGYAYSGVYREVGCLIKNGLLVEENAGGRVVTLSNKMKTILAASY